MSKYTEAKERLIKLLEFYYRNDIPRWDRDNTAEIEQMVDEIQDMIEERIAETIAHLKIVVKP
jgi:hypothetical protein